MTVLQKSVRGFKRAATSSDSSWQLSESTSSFSQPVSNLRVYGTRSIYVKTYIHHNGNQSKGSLSEYALKDSDVSTVVLD